MAFGIEKCRSSSRETCGVARRALRTESSETGVLNGVRSVSQVRFPNRFSVALALVKVRIERCVLDGVSAVQRYSEGLGELGRAGCFSLPPVLIVRDRDMLDPSGEAPSPLRTAAAVKVCE